MLHKDLKKAFSTLTLEQFFWFHRFDVAETKTKDGYRDFYFLINSQPNSNILILLVLLYILLCNCKSVKKSRITANIDNDKKYNENKGCVDK